MIANELQSSFVIMDSRFFEGSIEIGVVRDGRVRWWWWWWWWPIRGGGRAKREVLDKAIRAEIVLVLDWSGIGTPLTIH